MKRILHRGLLAIIAAFALPISSICLTSAVMADDQPSVNGHGNLTIAGDLQTVSFQARRNQDGTVGGSLVIKSRGQNIKLLAELDCIRINPDGKTAFLSGTITRVNNNASAVGLRVLFRVRDNGEGDDDPPDQMSDLCIYSPDPSANCNLDVPLQLQLLEAGNIKVRP